MLHVIHEITCHIWGHSTHATVRKLSASVAKPLLEKSYVSKTLLGVGGSCMMAIAVCSHTTC